MKQFIQQSYTGERALFHGKNLHIVHSIFEEGESPLKESRDIEVDRNLFKWKYPLWYSGSVEMKNSILLETARSGIWYTDHIHIKDSVIEAPKTFRRSSDIRLENVQMPSAAETLWNCRNVELKDVTAHGHYFGMNSRHIAADGLQVTGNYAFDGASDIEIRNAKLLSKDAFWNCENVTVYDSVIIGEYIGWNSRNLTFVNCMIESLQGFCYIDNLVIRNTQLLNTTLAFEYSTVDVEAVTRIDSIKNPISGTIRCPEIGELILEADRIDPDKVEVLVGQQRKAV